MDDLVSTEINNGLDIRIKGLPMGALGVGGRNLIP